MKFHATDAMPVATAHGLLAWFSLVALGLTALDAVRRRAFEFFKVRERESVRVCCFWGSIQICVCVFVWLV